MLKGLHHLLGADLLAEGREVAMGSLARADFSARSREAFAIVSTSEARPYGCVLLVKGMIESSRPPEP